jgi:predicted peptidase
LALVCCLNVYGQGQGQGRGGGGDGALWDLYVAHDDVAGLPYRLMSPAGFEEGEVGVEYPVIVSLHGGGGTGTDNRKQLKDWNRQLAEKERREAYPCYVLAPQADHLWDGEHLKKIKEVIAGLEGADMDRIYMLGHSMGGHGTYILLQIDPGYFAAAAPSAGTGLKRTEPFITAQKIKDVPIWAFHGSEDRTCPYERQAALLEEMKALGGNMKLTTWKGDKHGVSGKMIPGAENGETTVSGDRCDGEEDFMEWLFKRSLKERASE